MDRLVKICDNNKAVGRSLVIYKLMVELLETGEDFVHITSEDIDKTMQIINNLSEKKIEYILLNESRQVYKIQYVV